MAKYMVDESIDTLVNSLVVSDKDNYDFTDIINLHNGINRCMHLGAIDNEIADVIDNYIRFFNTQDKQNNTPIEERKPIKIFIDSVGGDIMGTLTIIDSIRQSDTPVITINTGQAYSGGFFCFIAGHKRICYPNASFLFHEGSTGTFADANKFNNWADFYKKILRRLRAITLEFTNITEEEYNEHQKDDWWFFAEEALEKGICDEISKELI